MPTQDKKSSLLLRPVAAALLLAVAGGAAAQSGGAFDLSWSTIEAGGEATGGTFAAVSVFGQADAAVATATGGSFSVTGGFMVVPPEATTSAEEWLLLD